MSFDKLNIETNKRIHTLSMKIGKGISDRKLSYLFSLIYPKIRWYIINLAGAIDDSVVDELVQQVMFKSYNYIDTWDSDKGSLTTWVHTIARNDFFQYIKDKRKQPVHFSTLGLDGGYGSNQSISDDIVIRTKSDNLVETQSPLHLILDREESEAALQTINNIKDKMLSDIHKSIFEDYIVNKEKKLKDIAAEYNLNVNTVKSKLYQVRRKLRVEYGSSVFEIFVR
jgi:RNA polymerase sigma factor (sigma-70 family)